MTLEGSLFRVLTASDVEVPLGQNLETCVNPRARWYMAEGRFVTLSGSRKFVKQRASKQRESCELGVRFSQRI